MNKTWIKLLSLIVIIALVIVLFERTNLYLYLNLDSFNHYHNQILHFEQQHLVEFTVGYIIAYIFLIALCVPGTILFDLLAGFIYGPIVGTILVLICYLSGAVLNFILVRFMLYDLFSRKFGHLQSVIVREGGMRSTAINLIGLRFIPVIPFWLINILAAVLGIPFWVFATTTFLGIIPTSVVYVLIGHGVRTHLNNNQPITMAMLTEPHIWVPLLLLAMLILIPNFIKMIRKKKSQPQGQG